LKAIGFEEWLHLRYRELWADWCQRIEKEEPYVPVPALNLGEVAHKLPGSAGAPLDLRG
jgi:hypothetical protein